MVAAQDSDRLWGLDAISGHLIWATARQETSDVNQLLGVVQTSTSMRLEQGDGACGEQTESVAPRLVASGDRLYWCWTNRYRCWMPPPPMTW